MNEGEHWETRTHPIICDDFTKMSDLLNAFFTEKWVTASPMFHEGGLWHCMVYYKVPPAGQQLPQAPAYQSQQRGYQQPRAPPAQRPSAHQPASQKQIALLTRMGYEGDPTQLSKYEASQLIDRMMVADRERRQ